MRIPIHEDHAHYWGRFLRHPFRALSGFRRQRRLPRYVWVEITKRCNMRCRSCVKRYGHDNSEAEMPLAFFEQILTRIGPYVSDINITGVGEPFFHRDIDRVLHLLSGFPNIHVEMTTNGQLLTEERLRKLSRMKCIVAFSLSGTSPDTYSFNREGGDLDKVKQALARARELELESANPSQFPFRRKIHFLIMRRNMAELPEAVRWAAKYGAMELILKPMDNWDLPPELWEAENPLNHREELRRGLEEAQKLGRELGVSIVAPEIAAEKPKTAATGATQAKGWLRLFQTDEITRRGYPRFEDRFCDFPFQTMYFHVDGKVSVCCAAQWHPERLGDLGRRSLPAIWNGWGYRRLRSGMLIGSHKPYCRACPLPNGLGRGNPLG